MKERIINYTNKIDKLLDEKDKITDIHVLINEHLVQIGFFQHERLIHLLVTLAFAMITFASIIICAVTLNLLFAFISILLLCLDVCYIMHYFLLENKVQYMYGQYDKMVEEKEKRGKQNEDNR